MHSLVLLKETEHMKIKTGDIIAVIYFIAYTCVVFFFPWRYGTDVSIDVAKVSVSASNGFHWVGFSTDGLKNFGTVVDQYPYITGFLKVGLLAIFGEMIKVRGRTGSWKTPGLFPKFIVWGVYGMLFTITFKIFGKGIASLMAIDPLTGKPSPVWPFHFSNDTAQTILRGFSTSLWANLIFCYPMMLSHEYWNTCINKKRLLGGGEFLEGIDKHIWGSFMLKTIVVFWIPAHTITFSLPGQYQVLMSAYLSLALGFILTIKPKKKAG